MYINLLPVFYYCRRTAADNSSPSLKKEKKKRKTSGGQPPHLERRCSAAQHHCAAKKKKRNKMPGCWGSTPQHHHRPRFLFSHFYFLNWLLLSLLSSISRTSADCGPPPPAWLGICFALACPTHKVVVVEFTSDGSYGWGDRKENSRRGRRRVRVHVEKETRAKGKETEKEKKTNQIEPSLQGLASTFAAARTSSCLWSLLSIAGIKFRHPVPGPSQVRLF